MNASWPLFRVFGIETRVHWATALAPLAVFCAFVSRFSDGDLWTSDHVLRLSKSDLHLGESAFWTLAWTVALFATVWTHEMAHALVGRRYGAATNRIALSPFSALVHPSPPMPRPRAELWTSLAGPAVQFAGAALLAVLWFAFGVEERIDDSAVGAARWPEMFRALLYLQLGLGVLNLLPVFPLDGGRCLRAAIAARATPLVARRWTTYVGYPGAIMLSIVGVWLLFFHRFVLPDVPDSVNSLLALTLIGVGLTSFVHCRSLQIETLEAAAARPAPATWTDARAGEPWKDTIAESERLARAEDRRERRAAEARRQEDLQRVKIQERIDELLDRINEVGGVENLTIEERRELAEASEMLRRETAGS